MNWFKKPQDLYDLLLLEELYYGNTGNSVTRVPGGWIFNHHHISGVMTATFVPISDEFLNLSNENIKSMADQDLAEP